MSRKNLILGGILVLLIVLAWLYQGPFQDWQADFGKPENILAKIDVEGATVIDITQGENTATLVKEGDKWKIDGTWNDSGAKGFYVDQAKADSLTEVLKLAVAADVEEVSANPDKKSEFNTDESGIKVVLRQGELELGNFIVGKLASDFSSTYISRDDTDNTYALKENIYYAFSPGDWYDKTIFSSDKNLIDKIRFQYPNSEFTIVKATSTDSETGETVAEWEGVLPYGFSVNKDEAEKVLNIMANLTAAKIPEQTFTGTGLLEHEIIVEATGSGVNNLIMVGTVEEDLEEDEDELYYVKRGDSDNIYLIRKDQRDELDKTISDLR